MLISKDSWAEIATGNAIIQKIGVGNVLLCYAAALPTTEDNMVISHFESSRFDAVTGKTLYAKASPNNTSPDIKITVELLA